MSPSYSLSLTGRRFLLMIMLIGLSACGTTQTTADASPTATGQLHAPTATSPHVPTAISPHAPTAASAHAPTAASAHAPTAASPQVDSAVDLDSQLHAEETAVDAHGAELPADDHAEQPAATIPPPVTITLPAEHSTAAVQEPYPDEGTALLEPGHETTDGEAADIGTPPAAASESTGPVQISVDNGREYQTMDGFGATHISLVFDGGLGDVLLPHLRAQAIDAAYNQVGLNTGNLEGALHESPGSYGEQNNDNAGPTEFNWGAFQTFSADAIKTAVVDPAQAYGFEDYFIGQKINVKWASTWLDHIRGEDYERYLDETGEQAAAGQIYWRDTYGIVPQYQMLFNEPLSGNYELLNGTTQDVVDIVARAGDRLNSEGFTDIKFVVPNEETVLKTLETASAVLSEPGARQYVGAIGYHVYPYLSTYARIDNILSTSGAGEPHAQEVAERGQLRDLARQHGVPLWMTEVSHGGVDPLSFDSLRGRAIHIHDELVYADAAAYFGMLNMWDTESHAQHFGNRDLFSGDNEGNIVFIDTDTQTVHISGMGYAIGHYARWIEPGAVRIKASSSDPLVQVTAFRDDNQDRLVLVIINNAPASRSLSVDVRDLALGNELNGEQSTAEAAWQSVESFEAAATGFILEVPAESVTTISGQLGD